LVDFPEALLEARGGRFLALRGELTSNNPAVTPRVRSLAAVFPRTSHLRYLPGIYQQGGQQGGQQAAEATAGSGTRGLPERFLALFESLTSRVDVAIDGTPCLLDPAAAPAEFLPWLSSWLALAIEEQWTDPQTRQFLGMAMDLYRDRGTREGISRTVALLTGEAPLIFEPFQLRCVEDPLLRSEYERLYGAGECRFCLLIGPEAAGRPEVLMLARRAVESETPAHVAGGVQGLRPWFHLGFHTYLGINTHLTEPVLILEESVLGGGETGLQDREPAGQVERRARLDSDTLLT
jgi:phage tail-like protein